MDDFDQQKPKPKFRFAALPFGIAIGAALGVAMHNVPIGVALGAGMGTAFGAVRR